MTAELNMPIAMTATLENRAKRYEASLRLSGAIASGSPDDLARDLAAGLRPVLSFDFLDVLVFKEGTNEVLWQLVGQGPALSLDVEMKDTGAWWIYENQQKLMIRDWNEDKRFQGFRNALSLHGIEARSVCGVPLTTPHRRIGVLGIASLQVNAYSEEDQHFLSFLAEHVALAIDNALNADAAMKAQADLEKQNERLKFLLDLTNRITSNLELRELLRAISASIRRVMECDGVSISLPTSEATTFKIYALDFPQAKGLIQEELTLSSHAPAFERAVNALKPVVVNPLDPSEYSPESYRIIAGEGIKAQCLVPLVSRGRVLGMLILGRMEEHAFCSEELEFLGQMAGQISIALENALAYQDISDLKDKLAQEKLYLEEEIRSELSFEQIIGKSPALMHVLGLVDTVAPTDSTVLLLGETGTGKELIARAIHDHSRRKDRTFVKLNCAAIPTGLLESELFGHEKGAFTGAISSKVGRLELADQGTLFLDEVGDIPLEIQPKLLRVLQEREFERLGSTHTKRVNVRLVAATNRDLEKMIADREFRSDLFYRLNVFPIQIPPLRDRREDIPLLVRYFVQKHARQMQKRIETIPAIALKNMTSGYWPGNVRELENFIERAVILTHGRALTLPAAEVAKATTVPVLEHSTPHEREEIARIVRETIGELNKDLPQNSSKEHDEKQRQEIMAMLHDTKGRVGGADGAAARMGIQRTTLLSRMKKFGLDSKQFSRP